MQSLPLYTSCLYSILLNDDIVDIEKFRNLMRCVYLLCWIWIFRVIFTSINLFHSTFKICVNNKWGFINFLYWLKSNILVFSEAITIYKNLYFHILFLCDSTLFFCSKRMKTIQTIKITIILLKGNPQFLFLYNPKNHRLTFVSWK